MLSTYTGEITAIGDFSNLLEERMDKANPRNQLSSEKTQLLNKLEAIAEKLRRGENV